MSAIEILFGSFIAGCVCSMKKMLKKTEKKFGGKEKRCTFAIPFGKRGSERPRRGQEERCGRTSRRGHRKFIEKTGQRQYKRSTENRERQFRVEIPELKMEPRDTA